MTWPTTPINTTNLDAGSDEPRLARADLLAMADAVNAMIAYGDPYNPASPIPIPNAMFTGFFPDNTYTISGNTNQVITNLDWYEIYDLIGISLLDYRITVPAGKYVFEMNLAVSTTQNGGSIRLVRPVTGTIFYNLPVSDLGSVYRTTNVGTSLVVFAESTTFELSFDNNNSNSSVFTILNNGNDTTSTDANAFILKITKVG